MREGSSAAGAPTKEPQQVRGPINLGHGGVGMVCQDLCILRPLEFVKELGAEHDIEILPNTGNHLVYSILSAEQVSLEHINTLAAKGHFQTSHDSFFFSIPTILCSLTCYRSSLLISYNLHSPLRSYQHSFSLEDEKAEKVTLKQCLANCSKEKSNYNHQAHVCVWGVGRIESAPF